MGRNPATGEAIKIPAKTVVKMRVTLRTRKGAEKKSLKILGPYDDILLRPRFMLL